MASMGLQFGLQAGLNGTGAKHCKRKFRWLMRIDNICDFTDSPGLLPPSRGARPQVTFKEMEVRHLNEHVYYPMKPEWKTINLVLYDLAQETSFEHPVFAWIKNCYNPKQGEWFTATSNDFIQPNCTLRLFDGCGQAVESWTFESVWPQVVEFGELDMASSDILTCDLTLRYFRAYIDDDTSGGVSQTI